MWIVYNRIIVFSFRKQKLFKTAGINMHFGVLTKLSTIEHTLWRISGECENVLDLSHSVLNKISLCRVMRCIILSIILPLQYMQFTSLSPTRTHFSFLCYFFYFSLFVPVLTPSLPAHNLIYPHLTQFMVYLQYNHWIEISRILKIVSSHLSKLYW